MNKTYIGIFIVLSLVGYFAGNSLEHRGFMKGCETATAAMAVQVGADPRMITPDVVHRYCAVNFSQDN